MYNNKLDNQLASIRQQLMSAFNHILDGLGIDKDFTIRITIHGSRFDYITIHCDTMRIAIYCDIPHVKTRLKYKLQCMIWVV